MMKKKAAERRDGAKKTDAGRRKASSRLGTEAAGRQATTSPAASDAGDRPALSERPDNEDGRLHRPGRDVPQPPASVSQATPEPPAPAAVAALAGTLGRELGPEQAAWLAGYLDDLHRWNRVMNLVGTRDWRETLETLVADSWHLGDFLTEVMSGFRSAGDDPGEEGAAGGLGCSGLAGEERAAETSYPPADPRRPLSLDLGAGAGLPGLPLRQFWTAGEYWLVEIRQKRASFMQGVLARRRLDRTRVFAGSVEDLPSGLKPADLVLSRAFRPWREVLAIAAGLVRREKGREGLVVILANQPPPEAGVEVATALGAVRFRLVLEQGYDVAGTRRYFWAFTPTSMPR